MLFTSDIGLAVKTPKKRIGEFQHILVTHFARQPFDLKGLFNDSAAVTWPLPTEAERMSIRLNIAA